VPGIGNPNKSASPFGGIQMAPKSAKAQRPSSVGDQLNNMAGIKEKSKYTDASEHNKMGKDSFLKLLTHQLQHQDPYKPMDQKKFASDLAQFSQLEQLSNMNKKMDTMNGNVPKETKFYGASFLGKQVETAGTTIDYKGEGSSVDLPFILPHPAKNLMVRVFDSKNQMVAQIETESVGAGPNSVTWNGKQLDGQPSTKDKYHFEVRAWGHDFTEFKGETRAAGIVTGVFFDQEGNTMLMVDGKKKVSLSDVKTFKLPTDKMTERVKNFQGLKKSAQAAYNNTNELTQ
jgi:flagellar basal-body rod modification protein FlgD